MVNHEPIPLSTVLADPGAVFDRVENERVTVSIMRGNEAVAVVSPPPIAETLAELHRALQETPLDPELHLGVIGNRRLLGL